MHSRHLLFRSAHQIFCGKFRSPELESDQQFENAERRYAGRGGKAQRFDLRGSNSIVAEKAADSARLAFSGTSLFQLQHHISKLEFFCDPIKASLISNHEHKEEMSVNKMLTHRIFFSRQDTRYNTVPTGVHEVRRRCGGERRRRGRAVLAVRRQSGGYPLEIGHL